MTEYLEFWPDQCKKEEAPNRLAVGSVRVLPRPGRVVSAAAGDIMKSSVLSYSRGCLGEAERTMCALEPRQKCDWVCSGAEKRVNSRSVVRQTRKITL